MDPESDKRFIRNWFIPILRKEEHKEWTVFLVVKGLAGWNPTIRRATAAEMFSFPKSIMYPRSRHDSIPRDRNIGKLASDECWIGDEEWKSCDVDAFFSPRFARELLDRSYIGCVFVRKHACWHVPKSGAAIVTRWAESTGYRFCLCGAGKTAQ